MSESEWLCMRMAMSMLKALPGLRRDQPVELSYVLRCAGEKLDKLILTVIDKPRGQLDSEKIWQDCVAICALMAIVASSVEND